MNNVYGTAFAADMTPTNYVTFIDPIDGVTVITGCVWTIASVNANRSSARRFMLRESDRVFTVAANYHVTIVA